MTPYINKILDGFARRNIYLCERIEYTSTSGESLGEHYLPVKDIRQISFEIMREIVDEINAQNGESNES